LESVNEFAERMALGIEEAKAALTKAKDEYNMYYNCRRKPALCSHQGTKSGWMEATSPPTDRHPNSLTDAWAPSSLKLV
jgi:hypothetical protein